MEKEQQSGKKWDPLSRQGLARFSFFNSIIVIGAQLPHLLLHEIGGHGLFGTLTGGDFYGFYISPFGISLAFIKYSENADPLGQALMAISGLMVSVILGLIITYGILPRIRAGASSSRAVLAQYLLIWITVMLYSDTLYAFFSPLFGFGDFYNFTQYLGIDNGDVILLLFLLPLIVALYYPIISRYLTLIASLDKRSTITSELTFKTKCLILFSTMLAPVLVAAFYNAIVLLVFSSSQVALLITEMYAIGLAPIIPIIVLAAKRTKVLTVGNADLKEGKTILPAIKKLAAVLAFFIIVNSIIMGPTVDVARGYLWDEWPGSANFEMTLIPSNAISDSETTSTEEANTVFSQAIITAKFRPHPTYYSELWWQSIREVKPNYDHYIDATMSAIPVLVKGNVDDVDQEKQVSSYSATMLSAYTSVADDSFVIAGIPYSGGSRVVEVIVKGINIVKESHDANQDADQGSNVIKIAIDGSRLQEDKIGSLLVRISGNEGIDAGGNNKYEIIDYYPKGEDVIVAEEGKAIMWTRYHDSYAISYFKPMP